ncbi:DUF1810 domain-containing protein [Salinarimonas rosea]|uniref:DUF1810 domain-containing protein n=1 Tax=Salinarimonas rosea TaxID=552063 RepID=UPI00041F2FA9|nr:DUF1810 domain-containing protein [Salinarimonas rosea]
MADDYDLARFVAAQEPVWAEVRAELAAGAKRSHWMWFVFPQLAALGRSATARRYGLSGLGEARAYLAHPLLGPRLREAVRLLLPHEGADIHAILGSPDDLKLRSCLTLFREATDDEADAALFQRGLDAFYGGRADAATLEILGRG